MNTDTLTLAQRCFDSDAIEDELFRVVNSILGCDSMVGCLKDGFIWGAVDVQWDDYDTSIEVIRPISEWMTKEQANQIMNLGFGAIYETCGDKARMITKGSIGPCFTREAGNEKRLRAELNDVRTNLAATQDELQKKRLDLLTMIGEAAEAQGEIRKLRETLEQIATKCDGLEVRCGPETIAEIARAALTTNSTDK